MSVATFFNCLGSGGAPQPWRPPDATVAPTDTAYFGRVMAAMERRLCTPDLTFFLTYDAESLPRYGSDVVAVLIGDERARVPRYTRQVRAVFKNLAGRPRLGCHPVLRPSPSHVGAGLAFARQLGSWIPGRCNQALGQARAALGLDPPPGIVHELPIGTFNVVDVPAVPFESRTADVFFAGSVVHTSTASTGVRSRLAPKSVSREAMTAALDAARSRRPGLRADVGITPDFSASAGADGAAYSRRLANARISLVPRGATPETHRFFQSLKYGCVVVTDALPSIWFYQHAPVVQLSDWRELDDTLAALLDDPGRMSALHRRALEWWHAVCSEEAVGAYMAQVLDLDLGRH